MPDGTMSAMLGLAAGRQPAHILRAERQDLGTARVIYQAQSLRRAFGRRAALTFMKAKGVPAALMLRVMATSDQQLRR